MKKILLLLFLLPQLANATVKVSNIVTRQSILDNRPITAYFTLENTGNEIDYLLEVKIENYPSALVTLHKTVIEKGVARIIKLDRLGIPSKIKFDSNKLRIYLVIEGNYLESENIKINFTFSNYISKIR